MSYIIENSQGLVGSAMVFAIQIYVVERAGPLFVSAYLPLQTLIAALLATFALAEHFYLGGYFLLLLLLTHHPNYICWSECSYSFYVIVRLIGAILIICGLYLVVLGKTWEQQLMIFSASEIGGEDDHHNKPTSSSIITQPLISSQVYWIGD